MIIRRYHPTDANAALALWRAASEVGHPFLTAADLDAQQRLVAEVYLPQAETWVAEREARLLGFIGLLDGFVGGLFVDPAAHRGGIGRALVVHARSLKTRLDVDVYESNVSALAFYFRCGFVIAGRRENDDEGRPLPLLRLSLV